MTARLLLVGLNHRTAPLEVRERVAVAGWRLPGALRDLSASAGLDEAVILSTCNRTELYAVDSAPPGPAPTASEAAGLLARLDATEPPGGHPSAATRAALAGHTYALSDHEAAGHLFRVACGLDSLVLGESEILGQVKAAYEAACKAGTAGPMIHAAFQTALRVGARARAETNIGANAVSVPSVALGLARKVFASLKGKKALLIGTGEIGRVALRHLLEAGLGEVVAANRTLARAEEALAALDPGDHPGRGPSRVVRRAVPLEAVRDVLTSVDIVVACSEAPHYVVGPGEVSPVAASRRGRPLLLIDLGVPRQIDPALAGRNGLYLFDLDDLEGVVQANLEERRREAEKVERLVAEEVERFRGWCRRQEATPVIKRFRARAEEIRAEELERLLDSLESASPRDRELLAAFSRRLTNRILDYPTVTLRELATEPGGTAAIDVFGRILRGSLAPRRENRAPATSPSPGAGPLAPGGPGRGDGPC